MIESELECQIAELDCAGYFKDAASVEQLRCMPRRQAWAIVRKAWKKLNAQEAN